MDLNYSDREFQKCKPYIEENEEKDVLWDLHPKA